MPRAKKQPKREVVTPDKLDLKALDGVLKSQGNAIPPAVATVISLAAPILARLAIRYLARRYRKKVSDQAVNTTAQFAGGIVDSIIRISGKA